ncbi:uncharacterized protein N7525_008049 [Penicillium rubens]|uniref:uncharacterized protein n=1 Tax=Penicillium rubens TaxID=1108849 RepID=UPI002A5A459C|nr:uncharacterized protein N7525_008049 [Penicillium rubens]KAJ5829796.1 hypothetical protein N7525_008049 [Penicillium rubens]
MSHYQQRVVATCHVCHVNTHKHVAHHVNSDLTPHGFYHSGFSSCLSIAYYWSIYTSINPLDRPLQSTTSSLTVAGFGLRTIGRLVSQPTSINPRDQPTSINHPQSDRGGPLSFRTIGRLVNQYTSINPSINTSSLTVAGLLASGQSADCLTVAGSGFRTIGRLVNLSTSTPHLDHHLDQPSRSTTINHFQSNRGGLRLQDNRQAGQSIHLDPLPRSPTTSLTVAGFGFRTIGRLVSQSTSINHLIHLDQPPRSTTIHHYQSDRGGLRLQDNRQAVQFKKPLQYTTSTNHINHINHALPVWPWRASASGQSADWAVNTPRSTTSINHYDQPTSINLNQPILINHFQSDRGGLQDNRQTGQSIHLHPPPRSPPRSTIKINHDQPRSTTSSLTVAGFRTIGRLVNPSTSIPHLDHHLDQPSRSTTINHFQSDRGGLRLQDNRQAGLVNYPPRLTTTINYPLQ